MRTLTLCQRSDGVYTLRPGPDQQAAQTTADMIISEAETVWSKVIPEDSFDRTLTSVIGPLFTSNILSTVTKSDCESDEIILSRLSEVEAEEATAEQLRLPIAGLCLAIASANRDPAISLACLQHSRNIMQLAEESSQPTPLSVSANQWLIHLIARQVEDLYNLHDGLYRPTWLDLDDEVLQSIQDLRNSPVADVEPQSPPSSNRPIYAIKSIASPHPEHTTLPAPFSYLATPPSTQTEEPVPFQHGRFGIRRRNAMIPASYGSSFNGAIAGGVDPKAQDHLVAAEPLTPPHTQDHSMDADGKEEDSRPSDGPSKRRKLEGNVHGT
ncbi:hypothetical protein DFH06DRAFT_1260671 [Mycena polygramma]|nr:hypothetical protein DFH06DRAFT_1260671 [Mycena polygramma]